MEKLRSPILLRCPKCNCTTDYDRKIDDTIPNDVKTIVSICPNCDDGDFHTETWLDACGFELRDSLGEDQ
jgi:hypothetical protein